MWMGVLGEVVVSERFIWECSMFVMILHHVPTKWLWIIRRCLSSVCPTCPEIAFVLDPREETTQGSVVGSLLESLTWLHWP